MAVGQNNENFRCYYCSEDGSFSYMIEHSVSDNYNNVLKLKKKEINPSTGRFGFRTLNYNVIPSILYETGKGISPFTESCSISKSLYPSNVSEPNAESSDICYQFQDKIRDLSTIKIRDHSFDKQDRTQGKKDKKARKGVNEFRAFSKSNSVREHHRVCESKILPNVRRGLTR